MLKDQDFLRYSRQLLLGEVGPEGQKKLNSSTVLLCGMGGLGSPAALYLAAAGVGTLLLADHDLLQISNLQRQILYKTSEIGQLKVEIATQNLTALNPNLLYISLPHRLEGKWLDQSVSDADLVLDCSDNMITRHAINASCIRYSKPLVSASAIGFDGQILVISPPWEHGCYACLFPSKQETKHNCRNSGVLGPLVGIMGSLQALEAIKLLCGISTLSIGKLHLFDGISLTWRTLHLSRNTYCPICSAS